MNEVENNQSILLDAINGVNKDVFHHYFRSPYLKTDFNELPSETSLNISLCLFKTNETSKLPFLEFVLRKIPNRNSISHFLLKETLVFPCFTYQYQDEKDSLIENCLQQISRFMFSYEGSYEPIYKGFREEEQNVTMFFEIVETNGGFHRFIGRNDECWFVIVDEIMNQKHSCRFEIHNTVVSFFEQNYRFLMLEYDHGEIIETPVVAYVGKEKSRLEFTYTFGETRKNGDEYDYGDNYYFYDYEKAVLQAGWDKKGIRRELYNCGIIKFALFLGNIKYISETDGSSSEGDETNNEKNEYTYDSIRADYKNKNYKWIVRNYNQMTPLTYHYLDDKTLDEESQQYYIM